MDRGSARHRGTNSNPCGPILCRYGHLHGHPRKTRSLVNGIGHCFLAAGIVVSEGETVSWSQCPQVGPCIWPLCALRDREVASRQQAATGVPCARPEPLPTAPHFIFLGLPEFVANKTTGHPGALECQADGTYSSC